jgi:hypothetical protein
VVAHIIPVKVVNKHNLLLKINNCHLKGKLLEKLVMSHVNLRIFFNNIEMVLRKQFKELPLLVVMDLNR